MASAGTRPPSTGSVEEVSLSAGEQVGHENQSFAARVNKAAVVVLKDGLIFLKSPTRTLEVGVFSGEA